MCGHLVTIFSGQLPTGNLLILTPNVSGADNTAVGVICWFFTFFYTTLPRKALCSRLLFSSLIVKTLFSSCYCQSAMFLMTRHSLTNVVNTLIHRFNFGLVTLLLHNRNTKAVFTVVKNDWNNNSPWSRRILKMHTTGATYTFPLLHDS